MSSMRQPSFRYSTRAASTPAGVQSSGQLRERDRVADDLIARVRELYDRVHELEQQQQQQPVVHAEVVVGGGGDEDRDAADDDVDETA